MKNIIRPAAQVMGLLTVALLFPGAAQAGASGITEGSHCVGHANSAQRSRPVADTPETCFATYREAIAFASEGRITDAPTSVDRAVRDRGLQRRLAAERNASGEVIAATLFDETSYGGASLTVKAASPCVKNNRIDWWVNLENIGWSNRVSSVQPWADCWIWLYPKTGTREGPYRHNTPDVGGSIDNRANLLGLS